MDTAAAPQRPARIPGVCPVPFEPTFVRLPGDAGRIEKLVNENRILALVHLASEGECIALREEIARLTVERDALRDRLAATAPAEPSAPPERARAESPARARKPARARRYPDWLVACLAALVLFIEEAWYPNTEIIA